MVIFISLMINSPAHGTPKTGPVNSADESFDKNYHELRQKSSVTFFFPTTPADS